MSVGLLDKTVMGSSGGGGDCLLTKMPVGLVGSKQAPYPGSAAFPGKASALIAATTRAAK